MDSKTKKKNEETKWNISISGLFIPMVMTIVLISSIAAILIFVQIYRAGMEQSAVTSSSQISGQVEDTVEDYTNGMQDIMNMILKNLDINTEEKNEFIHNLLEVHSDIVAITTYDEKGNLLECWSNGQELKEKSIKNLSYVPNVEESARVNITKPHVQTLFEDYYPWVVTVFQHITNENDQNIQVAIDIRFSSIANYIDNVGIGQHGYCYIADKRGNLIYHPQQQLIYSGLKKETGIGFREGTYVEEDVIYTVRDLEHCDWKVVGVCYVDEMVTKKVSNAVEKLLLVLCVVLIATFLLGWAFSELFSRPVKKLARAMHEFEKNAENFEFNTVRGTTEIMTLSNSFDHMVVRIQELMEQVRQEEISLRKTELKALQAQINPHFLYNTLDAIAWLCEEGKSEDAEEMVTSLQNCSVSVSAGDMS